MMRMLDYPLPDGKCLGEATQQDLIDASLFHRLHATLNAIKVEALKKKLRDIDDDEK